MRIKVNDSVVYEVISCEVEFVENEKKGGSYYLAARIPALLEDPEVYFHSKKLKDDDLKGYQKLLNAIVETGYLECKKHHLKMVEL